MDMTEFFAAVLDVLARDEAEDGFEINYSKAKALLDSFEDPDVFAEWLAANAPEFKEAPSA